jgi:hypothetical protein
VFSPPLTQREPMDYDTMVQLARRMAMNIQQPEEILKDYGKTLPEFQTRIETNSFYQKAYQQYLVEWNGITTTEQRYRLIAAAYSEELLPHVAARIRSPNEPLSAAIEGLKTIAKFGGMGEPRSSQAAEGKFVITINLGEDTHLIEKNIAPKQIEAITDPNKDSA